MSYKIGQRVETPHGPGEIMVIETVSDKHPRAGVKHDIKPKVFTFDILYYFFEDLKNIEDGKI